MPGRAKPRHGPPWRLAAGARPRSSKLNALCGPAYDVVMPAADEPLPLWKAATLLLAGPLAFWLLVLFARTSGRGHAWLIEPALLIGTAWLVCLLRVSTTARRLLNGGRRRQSK